MAVHMGRLRLPLISNSTSKKSKMAATAIFKIHINCHNSIAVVHIHIKFGQETKTEVLETEILSNLTSKKSNMAAGLHFEIHKLP